MKCIICKSGETAPGTATVTFDRDGLTLVIKDVPARVCSNCGEEYVDEDVAKELLASAERMAAGGAQVDVRRYIHGSTAPC